MSEMYGVFVEERASEEDGGALLARRCVLVCDDRTEAEDFCKPYEGLTSRIRFWVEPVQSERRKILREAP